MSAGLLILIPAAAGYLWLVRFPHTRYSRHYWSGYHLLFRSFFVGIGLTSAAVALYYLLDRTLFPYLDREALWFAPVKRGLQNLMRVFLYDQADTENYSQYAALASINFMLAVLVPVIYEKLLLIFGSINDQYDLNIDLAQKAARRRGDFIEAELAEVMKKERAGGKSSSDNTAVELLLEYGIVYEGLVLESGVITAAKDTSIRFLLTYCRRWDEDVGKSVTQDDSVQAVPPNERGIGGPLRERADASIVTIPVSRIVSIQLINLGNCG